MYFRNLQHAKKDLKWLKGVTGQWFEDTKKKKYKNEADVSDLLKQPLSLKVKNNTRAGESGYAMSGIHGSKYKQNESPWYKQLISQLAQRVSCHPLQ